MHLATLLLALCLQEALIQEAQEVVKRWCADGALAGQAVTLFRHVGLRTVLPIPSLRIPCCPFAVEPSVTGWGCTPRGLWVRAMRW
jgi:hypothetical protein